MTRVRKRTVTSKSKGASEKTDIKTIGKYATYGVLGLFLLSLVGLIAAGVVLQFYSQDLPDYKQLADYNPPVVSRVYAGNGELVVEYAHQNRVFVPINVIPKLVIKAFLSAEDKNFYNHPGVDFTGVIRAIVTNVANIGKNRRPVGASTVTQQVAKNFLLTNELSIARKVKEAILAFRIERTFSKDEILELYLNEIYLGGGAYGVAAAALYYFDKSLDELTVEEAAYLAALPKAPNNYHPVRNYENALARRNWVISRMSEDGYVSDEQAAAAQASPLVSKQAKRKQFVEADYFGEEVRRDIVKLFGSQELYGEGLYIKTSLDPDLQELATDSLRKGLESYDRRHGYRGPLGVIDLNALDDAGAVIPWTVSIENYEKPSALDDALIGVVLTLRDTVAEVGLKNGEVGYVPVSEMQWARPVIESETPGKKTTLGPKPESPSEIMAVGDVIALRQLSQNAEGQNVYSLHQIPALNGALVAMDPHTGRVLAMVGGYDRNASEFNRATQAYRQPGSAIKPFIYLSALNNGLTPATLILDAPFVVDQGPDQPKWKPSNHTERFYGPAPMRTGIEQSRNLMTVRLAQTVGMKSISETVEKLSIMKKMPRELAMALGAGETSLLNLSTAYAMLVNGGKQVVPSLIDSIQDRRGRLVYRHDTRSCDDCQAEAFATPRAPKLPDDREQVTSPQAAYQIVSMLEGAIQRGTGRRIRSIGKPIGGKTGTTNDVKDTWFIGFTPDLVVGVYAGFDTPKPMGRGEYGSTVAAPIFKRFMQTALKRKPSIPFRIPEGIRLVRMNGKTGQLASPGDESVILEAFQTGTEPTGDTVLIEGIGESVTVVPQGSGASSSNLEGIY